MLMFYNTKCILEFKAGNGQQDVKTDNAFVNLQKQNLRIENQSCPKENKKPAGSRTLWSNLRMPLSGVTDFKAIRILKIIES